MEYHINIEGTGEYLAEKVKQYKKSVFLGGSAGGYAAILFAGLARADHCIAFNPQTDLDDCESNPEIAAKYDFTKADRDYMDVTQWLRGNDSILYLLVVTLVTLIGFTVDTRPVVSFR